jgi:hypothetical protein
MEDAMQNEYSGNIPPETPRATPPVDAPKPVPRNHTRVYWAVGALVVVIVAIFAMTARQPGTPLPDETAPAVTPAVPPGASSASPPTPPPAPSVD